MTLNYETESRVIQGVKSDELETRLNDATVCLQDGIASQKCNFFPTHLRRHRLIAIGQNIWCILLWRINAVLALDIDVDWNDSFGKVPTCGAFRDDFRQNYHSYNHLSHYCCKSYYSNVRSYTPFNSPESAFISVYIHGITASLISVSFVENSLETGRRARYPRCIKFASKLLEIARKPLGLVLFAKRYSCS
ncbi:hypothetical protein GYMLUDRAFT_61806 [Collybiopsis luxurians FD-317 M1]|uniref:Uncharacterized protein n=1 Tax=Collybiopsis luxurians FD-317 M1 TaxID=944289 RepID=A0A0D0C339_9AGAR|nr:hypothetical protein GYMLUDRAFT_61806 [Collybiopsis luxurians FD-317 M1]